jgi:hypothetical protein
MTVAGGDYVLTVGSLTQGDEEFVYAIDTREEKLLVYRFDTNRKQIEIVQGIDLAELRRASTPPTPPDAATKPPISRQP